MRIIAIVGRIALVALFAFAIAGCADMSYSQQRMLSGGAIGAGTGAALGAITGGSAGMGAVIGGAAGVVGGVLVDQYEKSQGRP
jgi:osmotically inducible lipoprotein OsmB